MAWFDVTSLIMLILFIILLPVSALLLWLTAKIFKIQDQSFKTVFQVVLFVGVINLIISWVTINIFSVLMASLICGDIGC